MKDIATSLPAEIWLLIFDQLFLLDILQLRLVHRVFHGYSQQRIWEDLTLCTLEANHYARCKAILRDPSLGPLVRNLFLTPFNNHRRADARTNLWICDPPIENWSGLFRSLQWKRPLRSLKWFRLSRKGIDVGASVTSHLTNIRRLSLSFSFPEDFHPSPEPYRRILSNLPTTSLQFLDLRFTSATALQIFGEALHHAPPIFENLQTLFIDLRIRWYWETSRNYGERDFQTDIQAISNTGRNSLRSLRICIGKLRVISSLHPLFNGLGVFPNLDHFSFSFLGDYEHNRITEFLRQHHPHLKSLDLQNLIHRALAIVDPDDAQDNRPMPELQTLSFFNRHHGMIPSWPLARLRLRPYANSLTTLVISNWWFHPRSRNSFNEPPVKHGFEFDDVKELLLSLRRPNQGALLRRLKIHLLELSPELFDLMSNYLDNLQILDISYHDLVAQKGDAREGKANFWRKMSARCYSNWGLKAISLNRATSQLYSNYAPNPPVMRLLARRIPSVREIGPLHWSEADWH
ncbi:hypothetical protein BDN72DRAFT_849810 [Pluteus cervinus]|uniref:Uncharacterized protein n=1 Tax=Pluteus cervinus TaxID=181527 RepID=A0ACD3A903_9AGAR|nr:hypothetical protein BDN72DRAFT_849810 [Pluteus cervinus]